MSWCEFWNRDNSIYVNARHRALHYDGIAKGIAALVEDPGWTVLDHGSGEAASADLVARRCAKLYLYDAAPNVQGRQRLQFSRNDKIVVLDQFSLEELADASLDLVVANSLIQYLARDEFQGLLDFWYRKLKPGAKLVVADVIPEGASATDDIRALLGFGLRGGFFFAACMGLVSTFFSDYRKLRTELGLTRYTESDMLGLMSTHGFVDAHRSRPNIGHNQSRMMFVARRA
jgi:ubiquinone/menaquinone biosynthesis C-methylase UbiE